MKTLKGLITFTISLILLSGCMPDSLTKFKEEQVEKTSSESSIGDSSPPLVDDSGNTLDPADIDQPVSIDAKSIVCIVGQTCEIRPTGDLGDITLETDGSVSASSVSNLQSEYSASNIDTGDDYEDLSIDQDTGTISGTMTAPINPASALVVTLDWEDPTDGSAEQITQAYTITAEQEYPDLRFEHDPANINDGTVTAQRIKIQLDDGEGIRENFNNGVITDIIAQSGATGEIKAVDENIVILEVDVTAGNTQFKIGDVIDGGTTFFSDEAIIRDITYIFATGADIALRVTSGDTTLDTNLLDTTANGSQFTINPQLQIDGVDAISGTTNFLGDTNGTTEEIQENPYEITVRSATGLFTQTIPLNFAVIETPKLLTYYNYYVLEVDDAGSFQVGESVASSFTAPLTSGGSGTVRFVQDNVAPANDFIIVQINNPNFKVGQTIDDYSSYLEEEAEIVSVAPVSHALKLSDTTNIIPFDDIPFPQNLTDIEIICGVTSGEQATVQLVDTASDIVFVTHATTDTTGFQLGESIDVDDTTCSTLNGGTATLTATIDEMWTPFIKSTLGNGNGQFANFKKGLDIIYSHDGTAGGNFLNMYIDSLDTGTREAILQLNGPLLLANADAANGDVSHTLPFSAGTSELLDSGSDIFTYPLIVLKRDEETALFPFLASGDSGAIYTISPDLPAGLTLSSSTGAIEGTPSVSVPATEYTITSTNSIGAVSTKFYMKVSDYFGVKNITTAASTVLHRVGQNAKTTSCEIRKEDVDLATLDSRIHQIDCLYDVGELELALLGVEIEAFSGPGVCEAVRMKPYSYFTHRPFTTEIEYDPSGVGGYVSVVENSCTAAAAYDADGQFSYATGAPSSGTDIAPGAFANIPTSGSFGFSPDAFCGGKYGAVNCDQGSYSYAEIRITEGSNAGVDCNVAVTVIDGDCGGSTYNCLGGPLKQLELGTGSTYEVTDSTSGFSKEYKFTALEESILPSTSKRLANYTNRNVCYDSADQITYNRASWLGYTRMGDIINPNSTIHSPFMGPAHPYYTVQCLDGSDEVKAEINIMVREWNINFSTNDDIDKFVDTTLMDNTGVDTFGYSYNNYSDWDDRFTDSSSGRSYASLPVFSTEAAVHCGDNQVDLAGDIYVYATVGGANITNTATVDGSVQVAPDDTVDITQGSRTITSNGGASNFLISLAPGMPVYLSGGGGATSEVVYVSEVVSNDEFRTISPVKSPTDTAVDADTYALVQLTGTVEALQNAMTIQGTGTRFTEEVTAGDAILVNNVAGGTIETLLVKTVDNDTEITLMSPVQNNHPAGELIFRIPHHSFTNGID